MHVNVCLCVHALYLYLCIGSEGPAPWGGGMAAGRGEGGDKVKQGGARCSFFLPQGFGQTLEQSAGIPPDI